MWKSLKSVMRPGLETRSKSGADKKSDREILGQEQFLRMLALERKRTERSHRCFVLMRLESETLFQSSSKFHEILRALYSSTRETDITGWYKQGSILGLIFTEIGGASQKSVATALLEKVTNALSSTLTVGQINDVSLSFHVYPEGSDDHDPSTPADTVLYPDLYDGRSCNSRYHPLKRSMDIVGSLAAITFFLPLFAVIAVLIKLTSKGPVLFRQQRLGRYGREFPFLKFRSMHVDTDHTIHEEYVKRFIAAQVHTGNNETPAVYKLTGDPRVTRVGRFLRRSSLDELPQFFNVLRGQMSLVGPRPPLAYEFRAYDIWHRRRLLAVRPGITGLWQVRGRSRVTFDEMVRLDLRYAETASLWLDIKILLQTPGAVVTAAGAY